MFRGRYLWQRLTMRFLTVVALSTTALLACRDQQRSNQLAATGSAQVPDPSTMSGSDAVRFESGQQANAFWKELNCSSANSIAGQVRGKATVTAKGDGIEVSSEAPAICGGYHQVATKRFAVGDGTLFRACLADGSVLQISSDVRLIGRVNPQFEYMNLKRTGPLIEWFKPNVGAYNQRDVIDEKDTLVIDPSWKIVDLAITLHWPAQKKGELERLVEVTAHFDCGVDM
jgi:hypothetical protein